MASKRVSSLNGSKKGIVDKNRKRRCEKDDEEIDDQDLVISAPLVLEEDDGAGIIEKVSLKNFMCHANLEFEFGPHINFIIGNNGSGKSAVLNGIILGLGGKSFATGRNTNIRGFIQEGKDHAHISITLKNTGMDAYNPRDYGPRIIIERHILSDGQSNYKIKNSRGTLISSKREELVNILEALNIQVDNPVAVLTQEASRTFLWSRDPWKKYALFWKATQLDKSSQQYNEAERTNEQSKSLLDFKTKALAENEKDLKIWEEKRRCLNSLDEYEERIKNLENEFLWAIAIEAENEVKILCEAKEKCEASLNKSQVQLAEWENQKSQKLDKKLKLKNQTQICDKDISELLKEETELNKIMHEMDVELKKLMQDLSHFQEDLNNAEVQVRNLQNALEKSKQKSLEDYEEVEKLRHKQINACEEQNQSFLSKLDEVKQALSICSEEIKNKEVHQQTLLQKIALYKKLMKKGQSELSNLKASRLTVTAIYDRKMPDLLQSINVHQRRFRKKPFGPLGMYIKVQDSKWTFAVDICLEYLLPCFYCDNNSDRETLSKIARDEYKIQPNIIVSPFLDVVYEVKSHRVKCTKHPSILDVISCSEPAVLNCLIDQGYIERILLIEDSSQAMDLMMDNPPANCICAYTMSGDQVYPDPRYRYYSCKRATQECRYLRESITPADIRAKEDEIMQLKKQTEENVEGKKELNSYIAQKNKELKTLENERVQIEEHMHCNEEKIKQMKESRISYIDIPAQEEELKMSMLWRDKVKAEVQLFDNEIKEINSKIQHVKEQFQCNGELLASKRINLCQLQEEFEALESELEMFEEKKEEIEATHNSNIQKLEEAEELWNKAKKTAQKNVEDATILCQRIEPERKSNSIQKELAETRKIFEEQSENLNRDEINKNYVEYKMKFKNMKKEIKKTGKLIKFLEEIVIPKRLERMKRIRDHIAAEVTYSFQCCMSERNYSGRLNICPDEEKLEIEACAKQSNSSAPHKTSALSGGEKSYVTISLLLSLYIVTELPFHILDEYDVFMDDLNRNFSMKIMLDKIKGLPRKQFTFLSPNELPYVASSEVKVHKMPDPERPNS